MLTVERRGSGVRPVRPDEAGAGDGAVVVTVPIPVQAVVSVLVDGARLAPSVAAALRADPALAALDAVLASPPLWFDAAELPHLF